MALVMVLISHSGLSSSTSAHVLGSDGRHNTKRLKKKKKGPRGKVLSTWISLCYSLCLPIARLRSFCTLELTPTILYKPCSSIPERRRGEIREDKLVRANWWRQKIENQFAKMLHITKKTHKHTGKKTSKRNTKYQTFTSRLHCIDELFHYIKADDIQLGHCRGRDTGWRVTVKWDETK